VSLYLAKYFSCAFEKLVVSSGSSSNLSFSSNTEASSMVGLGRVSPAVGLSYKK